MPKHINHGNTQINNTNITGGNNNIFIINTEQLVLHKRDKRYSKQRQSHTGSVSSEYDVLEPGSIYE